MVIAYHLIITAYRWWLPNDPRGSASSSIATDLLKELGDLHFGRKKIQPAGRETRTFYNRAEQLLKHDLLQFDRRAIEVIAIGFEQCVRQNNYTCYASVIMFDHVHLCIRKHKHLAQEMIDQFQEHSAKALIDAGLRKDTYPTWGTGGWKVYLDNPSDVHRTIRYIEQNPAKMHQPIKHYPWTTSYDNWPDHRLRFSTPHPGPTNA